MLSIRPRKEKKFTDKSSKYHLKIKCLHKKFYYGNYSTNSLSE